MMCVLSDSTVFFDIISQKAWYSRRIRWTWNV